MKKCILALMGILILVFAASCAKEIAPIENEVPETPGTPAVVDNSEIPTYLVGQITDTPTVTKTSYTSAGVFSWSNTDKVDLLLYKAGASYKYLKAQKYDAVTIENDGKTATFKISNEDPSTLESGDDSPLDTWTSSHVAVYPQGMMNDHIVSECEYNTPFIKLPQQVSGASSGIILLGNPDGGTFKFKTAMAVLKVTVTSIPAEATALRLITNDKASYPIDGDFAIADNASEVKRSDYLPLFGSAHDYVYVDLSGEGAIASRDFYFNIPASNTAEDAYPAGTLSIALIGANDAPILEKTINKAIVFQRNDLLDTPSLANEWVTLGVGAFYDKGYDGTVWNYYHAEVIVQQNSIDGNRYRLIDPYGAYKTKNGISNSYTSDSYLEFEIVDDVNDYVSFEDHSTGLVINEHNMVIRYPSEEKKLPGNAVDITHNKILSKDGSGNPLIVQLAPLYKYEDENNGWTRYTVDNRVIIFFPGYERSVSLSTDSTPTDETLHIMLSCANAASAKAGCSRWASDAFNALSDAFVPATGTTFSGFSGNGLYTRQIAVVAYNSSGLEIFRDYFEKIIYTISAANQTAMIGTYWIQNGSSYSLTVAARDDVFKGNLMVTSYPAWSLTGKIYGCYNGSTVVIDDRQVFNQHGNGNYYGLHNPNITEVGDLTFTVTEDNDKKQWAISAVGIGIANMNNGVATSYSSTSHKWTSSPIIYQQ